MDDDLERRIRERAYEIWEQEGRSGDPEDHWFRAEQEMRGSASGSGNASNRVLKNSDLALRHATICSLPPPRHLFLVGRHCPRGFNLSFSTPC